MSFKTWEATTRHQNNWAILQKDERIRLCPLYDNGSSLCCYIREENIDSYLGNDRVRFNSLINSKSTSRIKIDKKLKKEPTHLDVLKYLKSNHYEDIIDIIKNISYNINEKNIDIILSSYTGLMSEKRMCLIKIVDKENNHVGYLPRYYSQDVSEYLVEGRKYRCSVLEVNKDMECSECIKVKLEVESELKQIEKIS